MDKRNFAFCRMNFILLAVGMLIIIAGFILMSGPGSTETAFNPDIFSARRIKVAPVVCFFGFIFMIVGIMYSPKDATKEVSVKDDEATQIADETTKADDEIK